MNRFIARLQELEATGRILIFDGAMGTQLQAAGLRPGGCPELWNLERPDVIKKIHRDYVEAGAQAVETNTFGASRPKLAHYGLEDKTYELNHRAVTLAREAVGAQALVVGSIGPLGALLEPLGKVTFREAYGWFAEQARAFADAGADAVIVETMADLAELRAAVIAVKSETDLPVIAHMTYTENGRAFTGTGPDVAVTVLEALGADVIGANCSVGPRELYPVMQRVIEVSSRPVSVMPNAGIPQLIGGQTVFPMGPDDFGTWAGKLVEAGTRIIGGCCGTTPEHIRRVTAAVERVSPGLSGMPPAYGRPKPLRVASRTEVVTFDPQNGPVLVGERINPTSRKRLAEDIRTDAFQRVRREARRQVEAGAHMLDVNVGVPSIDEEVAMARAVEVVQNAVAVPLSIDSPNYKVVESGLRKVVGKPLINSVTGEQSRLETVLPVARKYGAALIILAMDDRGIPKTAEQRLEVVRNVLVETDRIGIRREDLIVDALCLTVGAQQKEASETLRTVRLVREELGLPVMFGLSNVSFGMPQREFLNAVYMTMALSNGLSAAIVNPLDPLLMDSVRAVRVFLNRDKSGREYISAMRDSTGTYRRDGESPSAGSSSTGKKAAPKAGYEGKPTRPGRHQGAPNIVRTGAGKTADELMANPYESGSLEAQLFSTVLEGDRDGILPLVEQGLDNDLEAMEILNGPLITAIERVGDLFGEGIYFLPQLMLSAEAMKKAFLRLKPVIQESKTDTELGTVIMATVEGDVHDIGKNICGILLENYGFRVVDLGRDVPADEIVEAAQREGAHVVGLSALMTTTMPQMRVVIERLQEVGLPVPVMIGGAATTPNYARDIEADGHGKNAQEAVAEAKRLLALYRDRLAASTDN